jgi:hypothetical protein
VTQPESPPPSEERREFHRIHYPVPARPWFFIGKKAYEVLDISISGLRYLAPNMPAPNLHDPISGAIHFRHSGRYTKTPLMVDGIVVRALNDEVALYLNHDIPFNILLAEQQYLRNQYPLRFKQDAETAHK